MFAELLHKFLGSPPESHENHQKSTESDKGLTNDDNKKKATPTGHCPVASPLGSERDVYRVLSPPPDATTSTAGDEKILNDYEERINKLLLQFRAASENGLFVNQETIKPREVWGFLLDAKHILEKGELIECEQALIAAETHYHSALHAASWGWRIVNTCAFHLWIYFIGMILSISIFYFFRGSQ